MLKNPIFGYNNLTVGVSMKRILCIGYACIGAVSAVLTLPTLIEKSNQNNLKAAWIVTSRLVLWPVYLALWIKGRKSGDVAASVVDED